MSAQDSLGAEPIPFVADPDFVLYVGDVRDVLAWLPDDSIDCCATSPPYWGLRDYGHDRQIGLEPTPEEFVDSIVTVFRAVRRILKPEGTLWLNLGDSYAQGSKGNSGQIRPGDKQGTNVGSLATRRGDALGPKRTGGTKGFCKPKDLVGIPWLVAFALRADGWYLRSDIIWSKPNAMPEPVQDRPVKAHEYLFLLAKQARYHFDGDAIAEPSEGVELRSGRVGRYQERAMFGTGDGTTPRKVSPKAGTTPRNDGDRWNENGGRGFVPRARQKPLVPAQTEAGVGRQGIGSETFGEWPADGLRNARSVWSIPTSAYSEAHFATWPEALCERIIAAGCPAGGTVLDPFMGSGTTALVARKLGRKAVGIELNPEYAALCARRLAQLSLLAEPAA